MRLVSVTSASDPLGGAFETPPTAAAVPVTQAAWRDEEYIGFDRGFARRVGAASVSNNDLMWSLLPHSADCVRQA